MGGPNRTNKYKFDAKSGVVKSFQSVLFMNKFEVSSRLRSLSP